MPNLVALDSLQQFAAINLTADGGYDRGNRVIPNTAEITLSWFQDDGHIAKNILHASYQGVFHGSQTEADAILTGLNNVPLYNTLAGFMASTGNLGTCQIRDLNVKDAPIISSLAAGRPGTSPGSALPNEVAAVVTLRTAFVGRQNRGRMFIPNWATNALGAGNTIAAPAVTALGNWASIIAGVLQSQGYIFGIGHFHRLAYTSPKGTAHPERPAGLVPITNVTVRDNHWDTQRRRGLR